MGVIKRYMIVTNDDAETTVAIDLVGAKSVADYLGMTVQSVRHRLMRDSWKGRYKAIETGTVEPMDKKEYQRWYGKFRRKIV